MKRCSKIVQSKETNCLTKLLNTRDTVKSTIHMVWWRITWLHFFPPMKPLWLCMKKRICITYLSVQFLTTIIYYLIFIFYWIPFSDTLPFEVANFWIKFPWPIVIWREIWVLTWKNVYVLKHLLLHVLSHIVYNAFPYSTKFEAYYDAKDNAQ